MPLDMIDEDDCCGKLLSKALAKGHTKDSWVCPKCGCEWRAKLNTDQSIRHWTVPLDIEVLRI